LSVSDVKSDCGALPCPCPRTIPFIGWPSLCGWVDCLTTTVACAWVCVVWFVWKNELDFGMGFLGVVLVVGTPKQGFESRS
jgi:hypothetical protein